MTENELTFKITKKTNTNVSFSTKLRSCLNWSCLNYLVNAGLCDRGHITEVDSRPESKMMTECNVVWKVLLHPVKLMNFNTPLPVPLLFAFHCSTIWIWLSSHIYHFIGACSACIYNMSWQLMKAAVFTQPLPLQSFTLVDSELGPRESVLFSRGCYVSHYSFLCSEPSQHEITERSPEKKDHNPHRSRYGMILCTSIVYLCIILVRNTTTFLLISVTE